MNSNKYILNFKEILKILPHRYPFLLIDRILDFKEFQYLKALKNCTISEPFFRGHFIEEPIFPGVLIIEAMAQAAAILIFKSIGELNINKLYYFVGVENTRFKKIVVPGDQIFIEVIFLEFKKNFIKFKNFAIVNKKNVCKSTIIFYKKNIFS
ncbi:3-hydroxyacyl-ACP dehydratase FabZ [Buchnera aphidicola]|uniref:3-hydroxyacyl-[acyl-carrier-protein] dehydratase FabZ n=1 Tax=Buchnera aphidicola subsp. Rhopalosiphum maidis TaxID=118109 RepID=A0A3G2I684_BUCRM|nr:3-hydroxyacyl-ACP dehydratase FabZ [Buchnera aphidicola]AYN24815.1 3-hydroxyacyl-[acyl-carrier-protein] dehydratase FabZ [Buchnera aphidicola (Rhopalosiphum maidis)]